MIDYVASVTAILYSFGLTLCVLGLVCCLWRRTRLFGMVSVLLSLLPLVGALALAEQIVDLLAWAGMDLTQLPQDNLGNLLGLGSASIGFFFCLLLYLLFTKPHYYTNYTAQGYSVTLTETEDSKAASRAHKRRARGKRAEPQLNTSPSLGHLDFADIDNEPIFADDSLLPTAEMLAEHHVRGAHGMRGRKEPQDMAQRAPEEPLFPFHESELTGAGTAAMGDNGGIDELPPQRSNRNRSLHLHSYDNPLNLQDVQEQAGADFADDDPPLQLGDSPDALALSPLHDISSESESELELELLELAGSKVSDLLDVLDHSEPRGGRKAASVTATAAAAAAATALNAPAAAQTQSPAPNDPVATAAVGQTVGEPAEFSASGHFAGGFATMLDQAKAQTQQGQFPPIAANANANTGIGSSTGAGMASGTPAQKVMSLTGASPETSAAYEANSQLSDAYDSQQLQAQQAQEVKPDQDTNPAILKNSAQQGATDKKAKAQGKNAAKNQVADAAIQATAANAAANAASQVAAHDADANATAAKAAASESAVPDLGKIHVWGKFLSHLKELFTILESDFGYSRELISYIFMLETEPPMQSRPLFSVEGFIDNSSYVEQSRFTATFHENNLRHLLGVPAPLMAAESQTKEIKSATVAAAAMAAAAAKAEAKPSATDAQNEQNEQNEQNAPAVQGSQAVGAKRVVQAARASERPAVASLKAARRARETKGARPAQVFAPQDPVTAAKKAAATSTAPAPAKAAKSGAAAASGASTATLAATGRRAQERSAQTETVPQAAAKTKAGSLGRSLGRGERKAGAAVANAAANTAAGTNASTLARGAAAVNRPEMTDKPSVAELLEQQASANEGTHNESDVLSDSVIPNVQSLDKINQNGFIGAGLTVAEALAQLGSEVISTANAIEAHNKKRAAQPSAGSAGALEPTPNKQEPSRGALSANRASKKTAAVGSLAGQETIAPDSLQQSQAASLLNAKAAVPSSARLGRAETQNANTPQSKSANKGAKGPQVGAAVLGVPTVKTNNAPESARQLSGLSATPSANNNNNSQATLNQNKRVQSIFRTSLEAGGAHSYSANTNEESSDYVLLATMRTNAQDVAQAQQQSYLYQSAPLNISIPVAELNASASNVLGGGLVLVPAAPHNLSVSGSTGLAISNAATGKAPESTESTENIESAESKEKLASTTAAVEPASAASAPATAAAVASSAAPAAVASAASLASTSASASTSNSASVLAVANAATAPAQATAAQPPLAAPAASTTAPVIGGLQLFSAATGKAIDPSKSTTLTAPAPVPSAATVAPASAASANKVATTVTTSSNKATTTVASTMPNTAHVALESHANMAGQTAAQGDSGLLEVVQPTSALVVQSVAGGESHLAQLNGTRPAVPVQPVTPDANTKIVTRAVVTPPLADNSEPVSAQVPLSALAMSKAPAAMRAVAEAERAPEKTVLTPLRSHMMSAAELRESRAKLMSTLKQRRRLQEQQAAREFAEKTNAQIAAASAPESKPVPVAAAPTVTPAPVHPAQPTPSTAAPVPAPAVPVAVPSAMPKAEPSHVVAQAVATSAPTMQATTPAAAQSTPDTMAAVSAPATPVAVPPATLKAEPSPVVAQVATPASTVQATASAGAQSTPATAASVQASVPAPAQSVAAAPASAQPVVAAAAPKPSAVAASHSGSETVAKSLRQGVAERQARLAQAQQAEEQELARQAQSAQAKAQSLAEAQARTHEAVTQMEHLAARVQAKVQAQAQEQADIANMLATELSDAPVIAASAADDITSMASEAIVPAKVTAAVENEVAVAATPVVPVVAPVPVKHSLKTNVRSRVRAAAAELDSRANAVAASIEPVASAAAAVVSTASQVAATAVAAVEPEPTANAVTASAIASTDAASVATATTATTATEHQPSLMGRRVPPSLKKRLRTSRNS